MAPVGDTGAPAGFPTGGRPTAPHQRLPDVPNPTAPAARDANAPPELQAAPPPSPEPVPGTPGSPDPPRAEASLVVPLPGVGTPAGTQASSLSSPDAVAGAPATAAGTPAAPEAPAPRESAPEPAASALRLAGGVDTQLGGALYLVNLMRFLDLPDCFEPGWRLASDVGPWGVLDLLARGLLGEEGDRLTDDVLWPVLTSLDGRPPGTLPARGLIGSDSFRLPPAWTQENWPEGAACFGGIGGRRLRGWCAPGYLLFDARRSRLPLLTQIAQEFRPYTSDSPAPASFDQAPVAPLTGLLLQGLSPAAAFWLSSVLPYLQARLRAALGLAPGDDLARAMLLHRARLYITSSHVDMVLRLESIALPIRIAGLDRDPGWLPDFGRVVLFHFK